MPSCDLSVLIFLEIAPEQGRDELSCIRIFSADRAAWPYKFMAAFIGPIIQTCSLLGHSELSGEALDTSVTFMERISTDMITLWQRRRAYVRFQVANPHNKKERFSAAGSDTG